MAPPPFGGKYPVECAANKRAASRPGQTEKLSEKPRDERFARDVHVSHGPGRRSECRGRCCRPCPWRRGAPRCRRLGHAELAARQHQPGDDDDCGETGGRDLAGESSETRRLALKGGS